MLPRFMVHLVTEVDFVDGDNVSDALKQNYQQHLAEALQKASDELSLRSMRGSKVMTIQAPRSTSRSDTSLRQAKLALIPCSSSILTHML